MKLKLFVLILLTFPLYPMNNSSPGVTDKKISSKDRLIAMMLSLKRIEPRLVPGISDLKTIHLPIITKMYAYNVLSDCDEVQNFDKNPEKIRRDIFLCVKMMGQNKEIIPLIKYMIESYKEQERIIIQAAINAVGLGFNYTRIGKVNRYLHNYYYRTLLHEAVSYRFPSSRLVNVLLKWRANANIVNCHKDVPLDQALDAYSKLGMALPPTNPHQQITNAENLRRIIDILLPITDLSFRRADKTICVERTIQKVPSWMVLDVLKYTPDKALMGCLKNKQSPFVLLLNKDCTTHYEQSIKDALIARITQYCMVIQVPVQ